MTGDGPIVCIAVYGQLGLAIDCIRAVDRWTPEEVEVVVIDDCSAPPLSEHVPSDLAMRTRIRWMRNETNLGYLRTANLALTMRPGADVVLVNSDVIVAPSWFERLRTAAHGADNVATASAMTNEGTILTVEVDSVRLDVKDATDLAQLNERLGTLPPAPAPQIPVAVGHCVYIRADAISAVGIFDEAFGLGYEEEVDFSLRCAAAGLVHVLAPDVFVYHHGGASFGERASELQKIGHQRLLARYPDYEKTVQRFLETADGLRAAFLRAVLAHRQYIRLVIHRTGSSPGAAWDQEAVIELAGELGRREINVSLVDDDHDRSRASPERVDYVSVADLRRRIALEGRFDCLLALGVPKDSSGLAPLWEWAHRVVVLQEDFTDYALPNRHASRADFYGYRDAVVAAALTADAFVGATDRALRQGLVAGVPVDRATFALRAVDLDPHLPQSGTRDARRDHGLNRVAPQLAARVWEVCSSPPRIPADARRRIHSMRILRNERLRRLRRGPLGRALLPPGSARLAIATRLVSKGLLR